MLGLLGPGLGLVMGCQPRLGGEPSAVQATPGQATPGQTTLVQTTPGQPPDASVPGRSPGLSPLPGSAVGAASPAPAGPDALVAQASADAARRAGVAASGVRVVRVEPREWPDRSLGCPKPGMGYAQAITPGYLIVLEAAGRSFEYHTDQTQAVLCER